MESKVDEILKQLHRHLFADSQQIIVELKHYLHDYGHSEADLGKNYSGIFASPFANSFVSIVAFISSKIFNSQESLLEFLNKNLLENDKLVAGIKKRVFELIIEFIDAHEEQVVSYLAQVKETCMRSFLSDKNSLVKEAALQLVIKIIANYKREDAEDILKPSELIQRLLNEIRVRRPSPSVKGTIWAAVGHLHSKYSQQCKQWLVESQDQMYQELKSEFDSTDPKLRVIIGVMKGLNMSLEDDCTLDAEEVSGLFIRLKTAMQQIPDVRQKGVQKQAMKLFANHISLFRNDIPAHAESMVKLNLTLCIDIDMNIRDAANDMLGRLMTLIGEGLMVDGQANTIEKETFQLIVDQFKEILSDPNNNVQLVSAVKAIGVFSKAIKVFMGEAALQQYLERLIELSEFKLIKEFEDQKAPEQDV